MNLARMALARLRHPETRGLTAGLRLVARFRRAFESSAAQQDAVERTLNLADTYADTTPMTEPRVDLKRRYLLLNTDGGNSADPSGRAANGALLRELPHQLGALGPLGRSGC